ncbi:MAG TPA: bacteriohopanetetrol glucosamine biosynthesis glycosyltransferase HpnI [Candidatus Binatia bacterium]|jgi:ceramide glucosyltransferase|nr:bacteriohopanetetrol glucosamine biosynthesis glycosyltransferase HpnI [Candidatus Binatia bacterium]
MTTALFLLLVSLLLIASLYYLFTLYAAWRLFREVPSREETFPPVSIFKPLKGAPADLYAHLASFCRLDYPVCWQILCGVRDPQDPAVAVVQRLQRDFPERDIVLVVNPEVIGSNYKVSTLYQLSQEAQYDVFVISDSDVQVEPDYLRTLIPALADPRVGLVTCPYRGGATAPLPALLESLLINTGFASLILVASQVEKTTYAFGATIAVKRHCLEQIGGFIALSDYLADDYYLGHLVARAGYQARIAPYVVETHPGVATLAELFHHQLRWARTQRTCRPSGYFGTLVTYGTVWALCGLVAFGPSPLMQMFVLVTLGLRLLSTAVVSGIFLKAPLTLRALWLVPFTDVLSFIVWCASLRGNTVRWSEYTFQVQRDGKMARVG